MTREDVDYLVEVISKSFGTGPHPAFLEAIAMQLGKTGVGTKDLTIIDAMEIQSRELSNINDSIRVVNATLEKLVEALIDHTFRTA